MMNRVHLWHRFQFALSFADANVVDIRIKPVEVAQLRVVRAVERQNDWTAGKARHGECLRRLDVNNVTIRFGVVNGPSLMVQIPHPSMLGIFDRPLRVFVDPSSLRLYGRFTICVYDNLEAGFLKGLGKVRYEQLGSTVIRWGDCKERGRNESDFQSGLP
jgi:hypothetical protein